MNEPDEVTETAEPTNAEPTEPSTAADDRMTADEMVALARSYVETGTGKGIKRNDLLRFMRTLVAAASGAPEPAREAPQAAAFTPDDKMLAAHAQIAELESSLALVMTQARAGGLPEMPPGDHTFITSAIVASEDGGAVHVAKRANRAYTQREAIAFALDMLRKVRAIP